MKKMKLRMVDAQDCALTRSQLKGIIGGGSSSASYCCVNHFCSSDADCCEAAPYCKDMANWDQKVCNYYA